MRNRLLSGLILIFGTSANAQWLNYPTPGTPRTKDGKPNLAAKAPRAPNGKPDLSGVWHAEYAPPGEIERLFGDVFKDFVVPGSGRDNRNRQGCLPKQTTREARHCCVVFRRTRRKDAHGIFFTSAEPPM